MGQLEIDPVEVVLVELDEAALLELEAANDLMSVDVLSGRLVDLVVPDRAHVAAIEEVKAELLRLGRCEHLHRHGYKSEGDRTGPE